MDNRTFSLITAIQAECFEDWGTIENIETVAYFGSKENLFLEGKYIYIYYEKNKTYCFINTIKPDMILTIDKNTNIYLYKV